MIVEAAALAFALGLPALADGPVYRTADRAVSNWRLEAARALEASPERLTRIVLTDAPGRLPRCVRLNNYWCVKRAGWSGEIAADGEGHVAFSSAHEGAVVAAQLLRRYYMDLGRKSAQAIVSRWAPAECVAVALPARRPAAAGTGAARPAPRSAADHLTTRGIGNTVRARWLANRGKRVAGGRRVARAAPVRVAPSRAAPPRVALMRAPSIAVGLGERAAPQPAEIKLAPVRVASLAVSDAPPAPRPSAAPLVSCAGDAARIRAYAARMAEGVAASPDADLALFDAQGAPTAALRQVMLNMAAVEIGPLRVSATLVETAIEAHRKKVLGARND
ncbi:MAG TPA: hypothetical protein VIL72_10260 [Beijerinckiaceae bacterium]